MCDKCLLCIYIVKVNSDGYGYKNILLYNVIDKWKVILLDFWF